VSLVMYGKLPYTAGMSTGTKPRSARLEARVRPETLAVVKRAAQIQGRSVSDFIANAVQEAAHRAIEETQIVRLSVEDQRLVAEALLNPPEPTPALRKAFQSYKKHFGDPW
jgi:uncharacterized protein (DUF1778 family)